MRDEELLARMRRIIVRESRDWYSIRTGARLHKLGAEDAERLAPLILAAARRYNVPLAYLMAAICQESRFDPNARNPNGQRTWEGTDHGIAQLSGRVLAAAGVDRTKPYDPAWAVDYMARLYRGLLTWAKRTFPESDPLWVATLAYNKGRTGASRIIVGEAEEALDRAGRRHAGTVMAWYRKFEEALRG